MRLCLLLMMVVAVLGCSEERAPVRSSFRPSDDKLPQDDPRWSPGEKRIISAARDYLKGQQMPLDDARYNVQRTADGYTVFVQYFPAPGAHGILYLQKNGDVIRYEPGE